NDELEDEKSKSQVKREMHAMQELGRRLTELKPHQLEKLNLTDEMRKALDEAHRHTARGALKRHLSFVGKLMRDQDVEAIQAYIDRLDSSSQAHAKFCHQMERWRDLLLTSTPEQQEASIAAYPAADLLTLRPRVRESTKEVAEGWPPAASRKLVKVL